MPYIKKERRICESTEFKDFPLDCAGDLNYLFTEILQRYYKKNGFKYQIANDIVGALEGCKLEFVRRIVNEYEDEKIAQNGDVYTIQNSQYDPRTAY